MIDVALYHLIVGALLLFANTPMATTPLNALSYITSNHQIAGALLILSCFLFLNGLKRKIRVGSRAGVLSYSLQQAIVLIAAIGPFLAIWRGHYADLLPRPRPFIFADQYLHIQTAVFHSVAIFSWTKLNNIRQNIGMAAGGKLFVADKE